MDWKKTMEAVMEAKAAKSEDGDGISLMENMVFGGCFANNGT